MGNTTGVQLFHESGFDPTLAFELLGERAETVSNELSVDVMLRLDASNLEKLLRSLQEPPVAPAGIIDWLMPLTLGPSASRLSPEVLNRRILYRQSDAGQSSPGRTQPSVRRSVSSDPLRDFLENQGLTLLGHAMYRDNPGAVASSTRGGTEDEEIRESLPPGRYELRLEVFDEDSSFTLTVQALDVVTPKLLQLEGTAAERLEIFRPARRDMYRLTLADPTTVTVEVRPHDSDVDLELFDESGAQLGMSVASGTATDRVERLLDPGDYYVRVSQVDEETSPYSLTVQAAETRDR